jgi:hypothetical protein
MIFLTSLLGFFLMLEQKGAVSFGMYEVKKSLTPVGWAVVVLLAISLIGGIVYLGNKIGHKSKLK